MQKFGFVIGLLFFLLPLHAQLLTQEKTCSMWELNGPVHSLNVSVYRSDRFSIDGNNLNDFEKSHLLYFEDFIFDSLHSLTYYKSHNKNGSNEDFEKYTFDSLHRIVAITYGANQAEQEQITYHYNRLNRLYLANHYNDSGQLNLQTTYRFKDDRISEIKIYNTQKIVWSHVKYTYDDAGNLLEMRNVKSPLLQNKPYAFQYEYNSNNLKTLERYLDENDAMVWETHYKYDKKGRLTIEETYDGTGQLQKQIQYKYGRKNLLKYETRKDAARTQNITYYYDRRQRIILSSNLFGDVDFRTFYLEYDAYGNWTEKLEFDGLQLQVTSRSFTYFE